MSCIQGMGDGLVGAVANGAMFSGDREQPGAHLHEHCLKCLCSQDEGFLGNE